MIDLWLDKGEICTKTKILGERYWLIKMYKFLVLNVWTIHKVFVNVLHYICFFFGLHYIYYRFYFWIFYDGFVLMNMTCIITSYANKCSSIS